MSGDRVRFPMPALLLQLVLGCSTAGQVRTLANSPYLGEASPGQTPRLFADGIISGVNPVHGTPVFSRDGSEVFWSAVNPRTGKVEILFMKREVANWSAPDVASFSLEYQNDVPFIAPDGATLYFVSDRPVPWKSPAEKQNIWRVTRTRDGWSEPAAVDSVANSLFLHWQISIAADGTLYFATSGVGDIYSTAILDTGYSPPIRLGRTVNSVLTECCPFVSADGSLLLFARSTPGFGSDLYASFRKAGGSWSSAVNLGRDVNGDGHDLCPIVSPDGKYLFFLSDRDGEPAVYWVDIGVVERHRPRG